MQQPKISVVIPVYNAQRFIRQCLDSVVKQPMRELEVICVDDGSTDSSPSILDEYAARDDRIHIVHQPNSHAGIARNNGLDIAKGEYVHFLDADDYLTEDAYNEAYRIAHSNKLDCLKVKAYPIDTFSGEMLGGDVACEYAMCMMRSEDYKQPFSFAEAPEKLTTSPAYAPWRSLYRRGYLMANNIRFDSLRAVNDHSFYFAAATRAQRVMVADIYAVYHRVNNPDSFVGNLSKRFVWHFEAFRTICEDCAFLPARAYSLVLNAELESMFYTYNQTITKGVNAENALKLMHDFVGAFDYTVVADVCNGSSWYTDYLMLRHDLHCEGKYSLPMSEGKRLLAELEEALWKGSPLPVEKVRRNSKVVLYGAGTYGRRTCKLFQISRYCRVVLWVDKNWERLHFNEQPVCSPERISNAEYDSILVTVENPVTASEICDWLIENGVGENKIISNA